MTDKVKYISTDEALTLAQDQGLDDSDIAAHLEWQEKRHGNQACSAPFIFLTT